MLDVVLPDGKLRDMQTRLLLHLQHVENAANHSPWDLATMLVWSRSLALYTFFIQKPKHRLTAVQSQFDKLAGEFIANHFTRY